MKVFIDKIEEGWAVLITEKQEAFEVPTEILPSGAKEGMYIDISSRIDEGYTNKKKEEIRNLREKLLRKKKK